jgi:hypothetical protein
MLKTSIQYETLHQVQKNRLIKIFLCMIARLLLQVKLFYDPFALLLDNKRFHKSCILIEAILRRNCMKIPTIIMPDQTDGDGTDQDASNS